MKNRKNNKHLLSINVHNFVPDPNETYVNTYLDGKIYVVTYLMSSSDCFLDCHMFISFCTLSD